MTEETKAVDGASAGVSDSTQLLGKDVTEMVTSFIARQVSKIEEEHPLSLDFETDARDTWPDRWTKLKAMLIYLGT